MGGGVQVGRAAGRQGAARCRELGIPERFAPDLSLHWHGRGYDNLIERRKSELRRMAQTRIEAIEAKAVTEIELTCLEAQTALAVAGFLEALPSIEALMPKLSFAEVAGEKAVHATGFR